MYYNVGNYVQPILLEKSSVYESFNYQAYGVPRTVIDDVIHVEDALPESALLPELMTVLDEQPVQQLQAGML